MPLMLTNKSVHEMQADLIIHIQDEACPEPKQTGNFLQRYIRRLRGVPLESGNCYVRYSADMDYSEFETPYIKALEYAVRRGKKTVAVSCEDGNAYAAANQLSKSFAAMHDLQIWLCLAKDKKGWKRKIEADFAKRR